MRRVRRRGRERFRPLGLWELRDGAALCNEIRDAGSCLYQVRMTAKSARGGGAMRPLSLLKILSQQELKQVRKPRRVQP